MKDTVDVALEMSVIVTCHLQLSYHVFHCMPEEILVIEIHKSKSRVQRFNLRLIYIDYESRYFVAKCRIAALCLNDP